MGAWGTPAPSCFHASANEASQLHKHRGTHSSASTTHLSPSSPLPQPQPAWPCPRRQCGSPQRVGTATQTARPGPPCPACGQEVPEGEHCLNLAQRRTQAGAASSATAAIHQPLRPPHGQGGVGRHAQPGADSLHCRLPKLSRGTSSCLDRRALPLTAAPASGAAPPCPPPLLQPSSVRPPPQRRCRGRAAGGGQEGGEGSWSHCRPHEFTHSGRHAGGTAMPARPADPAHPLPCAAAVTVPNRC